jgi:hypothetical protein
LETATLHADLVHRMEFQHAALSTALDRIDKLTPAWRATANTDDRDALAQAVREASAIVDEHMAEEEQEILPLVRKYLTVEQWSKLGERGAESIDDKHKRLLFLGAILEDTSAQEEREFLSHLPAPVRLLWRFLGRRQYETYIRRVRGTA